MLVLRGIEEFSSLLHSLSQPVEETGSARSPSLKTDPLPSTDEEGGDCDGDYIDESSESEVPRRMTMSEFCAGEFVKRKPTEKSKDKHDDDHGGFLKQAYLLADVKERVPELPLVCVAEDDTILPLVTSALYHRMVWKIRTPVVGITFCPLSSIVRAVIGWLDEKQEDGIELVGFCILICFEIRLTFC